MNEPCPTCAGRGGLLRSFFAWMHSHGYGRKYTAFIDPVKRRLMDNLSGKVLEIGPGTGENLAYLHPSIQWIGIEPSIPMQRYLRRRLARLGRDGNIITGLAESIPVPNSSVDAVLCTLVLCSVSDQRKALAEVMRVLRPGGRFIFIEHVAAPRGTWLRRLQCLMKPLWSWMGDGCEPDRETWRAIESAGFASLELDHLKAPLPGASPHIIGWAVKP